MSCIFCKIANKEIEKEVIFEDEDLMVFEDINPKANTHLLIIPKKHIPTVNDFQEGDEGLISKLILTAKKISNKLGFADVGYKIMINVGKGGGQEIDHVHFHILSNK